MQNTIEGLKKNYMGQLKQQSEKIADLTRQLDAAKVTVEQLRGAVFALDQVAAESSQQASASTQEAVNPASPQEDQEQKEG